MSDLIDTNVLVRAVRSYYRMDFCPGFWDWLANAIASGDVVLVPEVRIEVMRADERLKTWLRNISIDQEVVTLMPIDAARRRVRAEIDQLDCTESSIQKFLDGADFHLVAYAFAGHHRIVTLEEKESPQARSKRLKIPDLCDVMGIDWTRTPHMLADHGVRLEWSGKHR